MFRMTMSRTARAIAAGAIIFALSATSLGGNAYAAGDPSDCSTAAHDRNDAVHLLHTAWQTFRGDLKDLAHDARDLKREDHKSGDQASSGARAIVAKAQQDLTGVWTTAHADIQGAVDLSSCGTEDGSTTGTTSPTTTTTNTTLQTTTTAPAPSDSTTSAGPGDESTDAHTFDTSKLAAQYKDIVDNAIKDMQKIVDDATKAVQDLSDATTAKDVTKAVEDNDKAETERVTEKAKADQERAAEKEKKNQGKGKPTTTSGKGSGKSNGKGSGKGNDRSDD